MEDSPAAILRTFSLWPTGASIFVPGPVRPDLTATKCLVAYLRGLGETTERLPRGRAPGAILDNDGAGLRPQRNSLPSVHHGKVFA